MKLLVTGGTVFASRFTAEYFAERGHQVFVLNRGTRPQPNGTTLICADRHQLGEILRNQRFDAILDITAYTGNDVTDLLDTLGEFGCYILLSSSAVYPEHLSQPFHESQQTGRNSVWGDYGTNKIDAETTLLRLVPDAYIIRPPYLYGQMNNVYREAFVFECAERGLPFYLPRDGAMQLQFYHISDLCRLIEFILIKKPAQHILNAGNPETISVEKWVHLCYDVIGQESVLIRVYDDIPQRSYFPFYDYEYRLDVTKMLELTPQLLPIQTGLQQSYEWWRLHQDAVIRKPLLDFIAANFK